MLKDVKGTIINVICAGLLLFGCFVGKRIGDVESDEIPIFAKINNEFILGYNQAAINETEKLFIRFINVAEDSRCPEGVECIWQGQVKIILEFISGEDDPKEIRLTSLAGHEELAEMGVGGYTVKLLKVEPSKKREIELNLPDYRITLIVSR